MIFLILLQLSLTLWVLIVNGCAGLPAHIDVPDAKACTAIGAITNGADCGTINSGVHSVKTGEQYIKWLNPSSDPKDSHASAICSSANDFGLLIEMIEITCTELKDNCNLEMQTRIENERAIYEKRWDDLEDSRDYQEE